MSERGYLSVAERLTEKFGFKGVAITLRESRSASDNDWSGLLYTEGRGYFSKKYPVCSILLQTDAFFLYNNF